MLGFVDLSNSLRFVENVAAESGGGAYADESTGFSVSFLNFTRNVATFGGGMAMKNTDGMFFQDCSECRNQLTVAFSDSTLPGFRRNAAVDGGGIHISSEHGQFERYWVRPVLKGVCIQLNGFSL